MTALTPWTIEKLLPLLQEAVAPLLPVALRFERKEAAAGNLCFDGERVASVLFEGLLPEEKKRWGPCALALVNEVFHRLVREKTVAGLPGPDLLGRELEKGPQKGLLLKTKGPPAEKAFALTPGLFFLPGEALKPKELLKGLWQEKRPFRATYFVFEGREDLALAPKLVSFFEDFGFYWFGGRAARYFSALGLKEEIWEGLKKIKRLAPTHYLLWIKGHQAALSCLKERARVGLPLTEETALLAVPPEDDLLSLLSSLSLAGGVLPPGQVKAPLKALWAAYEHARRLGEEALVTFEPFSWHVLGDVFLDLGDWWAARETLEEARGGTRQPIELLNSLALVYSELGVNAKAEECLREALALAPQDPMLYYNLAVFLDRQGQEEAISLFAKAYELAPQGPFAEALAAKLALSGNWSRIKEILSPLEKELSFQGLFLLARAYYETQELEKALGLFKRLSKRAPKNLEVLGYLALLYIHLRGEYSVAEAVLPELEKEGSLQDLAQNLRVLMEG